MARPIISNIPSVATTSSAVQARPTNESVGPAQDYLPLFGTYNGDVQSYPNDVIQANVFNATSQYLETVARVSRFSKNNTTYLVDSEGTLQDLKYISGEYNLEYKFIRNYLGSLDGHKIQIQEISVDRLEIRVRPTLSTTLQNNQFYRFFTSDFFEIPKANTLSNLYLFKTAQNFVQVFDYVQDKYSFETEPYSIIFKLTNPLPQDYSINDLLWLGQEVAATVDDTIILIPPTPQKDYTYIAGPNFDIASKGVTNAGTSYKDWEDLLTTNATTTNDLVNALLSGSNLEGINLNIDYRKFENFVNFGSAYERLQNFKYKVELIEHYDARIALLTQSIASSSVYFVNNINDATTKRAAVIGGFDQYEKYLYFESASYESSSFGEFYPATWPKYTSTKPYALYSVTSSQAESWFEGILSSASLYDNNNVNNLIKFLPEHILRDVANDQFVMFVNMMGHYYDLVYAYIKNYNTVYDRNQSLTEGFSKDLVEVVAKNLNVDFQTDGIQDLWEYVLGVDATGSYSSTYQISSQDRSKEIWKRIINNLPFLLQTKGTERGVRALINCYGIPATILRIREYGGPEPTFESKTDLIYDRFDYAVDVGKGAAASSLYSSSYYSSSVYSTVTPVRSLVLPWQKLTENTYIPTTLEFRLKMAKAQTGDQTIIENPGYWKIGAFKSGSGDYVGLFLSGSGGWVTSSMSCSIYDGEWHHLALLRSAANDVISSTQTYTLNLRDTRYEKVVARYSSSLTINGSLSSSYNYSILNTGSLWLPGSASFTNSSSFFTGSIQEVRYWTVALESSVLDNHALAPTNYQSNPIKGYAGSTGSYYELGFRLCLGTDNKKNSLIYTSSIDSQHPNQYNMQFVNGTYKSASFTGYSVLDSQFLPITEKHSLEWPDFGGNRSIANKIRIDNVVTTENQLYRNVSIQKSLRDNYPIDSPRLGVYLSPQNEISQDIAEQFGGLNMDDYIGDPTYLSLNNYPALERLKIEYYKKYKRRNLVQNYIRLLKYYDASLFELIKNFVPYRSNLQTGLVIEPTILERSKIETKLPQVEDATYETLIEIPDFYTVGGAIQDADGEDRTIQGYAWEGEIERPYLIPSASYDNNVIEGEAITYTQDVEADLNQFNSTQIPEQLSAASSLYSTIDLGITGYGRDARVLGSQYVFTSYYLSQSIWTPYTSSRYDYSEAIEPVYLDAKPSEIRNDADQFMYYKDVFNSRAFTDGTLYTDEKLPYTVTLFTASNAIQYNNWTRNYGLQIVDLYKNSVLQSSQYSTNAYWYLTGSLGLSFANSSGGTATSSIRIPAFFYNGDNPLTTNYLYEISIDVYDTTVTNTLDLFFGDLDSPNTETITPTNTLTQYTYITKATGPYLGLRVAQAATTDTTIIKNVSVKCLNYRAQTQDYHLNDATGMRNARYDGCKLTATDYNVNSSDTVDGGPVIQIIETNGVVLQSTPTSRGNFNVN